MGANMQRHCGTGAGAKLGVVRAVAPGVKTVPGHNASYFFALPGKSSGEHGDEPARGMQDRAASELGGQLLRGEVTFVDSVA